MLIEAKVRAGLYLVEGSLFRPVVRAALGVQFGVPCFQRWEQLPALQHID